MCWKEVRIKARGWDFVTFLRHSLILSETILYAKTKYCHQI